MADFQIVEPINTKKSTGWLSGLIILSIIFLVIAIGIYIAALFYQNYLNKSIADWDNKTKELSKEISVNDRNEVLAFYSQLFNLKTLLSQHVYSTNIFSRLELITHPQVMFTNFSYNYKTSQIKLEGNAKDLNVLAQQLLAFYKTTDFKKINISDIRSTPDNINFSLEINFDPNFILK